MKKILFSLILISTIALIICGCQSTSCSTKTDQASEISCNEKPTQCDINKPCAL